MYLQSDITAAIRHVQEYLYEIELHDQASYITAPDGIYGTSTKKAISDFQQRFHLPSTGIVDFHTFEALRDTALKYSEENSKKQNLYSQDGFPLRMGSRGADVDVLHALLRSLSEYVKDLPSIPRTSYFSAETERAVQYMQDIFQMDTDGTVDGALFDRLELELKARRSFQN